MSVGSQRNLFEIFTSVFARDKTSQQPITMSDKRTPKSTSTLNRNDSDDWDTDPDFIRDMDETEQRWGASRSIGSINMSKFIDEVQRDHELAREKFAHPSQILRNKFDRVKENDYDYKRTSKEVSSREIITSTSSSIISSGRNGGLPTNYEVAKQTKFFEKDNRETKSPSHGATGDKQANTTATTTTKTTCPPLRTVSPVKSPYSNLTDSSSSSTKTRETVREVPIKSANYQTVSPTGQQSMNVDKDAEISSALRSIHAKIDSFKRNLGDIESKIAQKTESSKKTYTRAYEAGTKGNLEFGDRPRSSGSNVVDDRRGSPTASDRPIRVSPLSPGPTAQSSHEYQATRGQTNAKSLSERFESMCRDDGSDFRRQTEEKRKEFFEKNQVRETRLDVDGFKTIGGDKSSDDLVRRTKNLFERPDQSSSSARTNWTTTRPTTPTVAKETISPSSEPSPKSYVGSNSQRRNESPSSNINQFPKSTGRTISPMPKVYTTRETVREEVISKIVKENDKVIKNDTKRNVERSSSHHGSSADEADDDSNFVERPTATRSNIVQHEPAKIPGKGLIARTLYDYEADASDELSFEEGDMITNIEKVDQGWYKGTMVYKDGSRHVGFFPANYVKLLNDTGEY